MYPLAVCPIPTLAGKIKVHENLILQLITKGSDPANILNILTICFEETPDIEKKKLQKDSNNAAHFYNKLLDFVCRKLEISIPPFDKKYEINEDQLRILIAQFQKDFEIELLDESIVKSILGALGDLLRLSENYNVTTDQIETIGIMIVELSLLSQRAHLIDRDVNMLVAFSREEQTALIKYLLSNLEDIRIISTLCPDYDWQIVNGKKRFTGAGLNEGTGLVADYIESASPFVIKTLSSGNRRIDWNIGYGAFEGTAENARANKIDGTEEEVILQFRDRLNGSADSMAKKLGLPVGLIPDSLGFSVQDFWALKKALICITPLTLRREAIDESLGKATSGVDWFIMGLISSSRNAIVMDGASVQMARVFYGKALKFGQILNELYIKVDGVTDKEFLLSSFEDESSGILLILKKLFDTLVDGSEEPIEWNADTLDRLVNVIEFVWQKIGIEFRVVPRIYIRSNYAGFEDQ